MLPSTKLKYTTYYDVRYDTWRRNEEKKAPMLSVRCQPVPADSTSTIFSKQINVPNGNIGFINFLYPNNFYIQSNLLSGNNIYLNSGIANTYLQSQNVYLGRADATGRKSNLYMISEDDTTYECQSSAFTEVIKAQILDNEIKIIDLEASDILQNTAITTLQDKTQNISSANSTSRTRTFVSDSTTASSLGKDFTVPILPK